MVNWFGASLDLTKRASDWDAFLDKGDKWPFNTCRIVIYPPSYSASQLEMALGKCADHGLMAVLDNHTLKSYFPAGSPKFGSQALRDWWLARAREWGQDPRVAAFELANEPSGLTLDASISTPNNQVGIIREYAALTDVIRSVCSMPVVWMSYWGASLGDLNYVDPTPYYRPDVVVTDHQYWYTGSGTVSGIAAAVKARMDDHLRRCMSKSGVEIFPDRWLGEIEGVPGEPTSVRLPYTAAIIKANIEAGNGFNYWHYGNPQDDGGLNPDTVIEAAGFGPAPPPSPYEYTITVGGVGYTVTSSSGVVLASGPDFATVLNGLHSILTPGDTVYIRDGLYPVTRMIQNSGVNNIHYLGESLNTILRLTANDLLLNLDGPDHQAPVDCTVDRLTFDANLMPINSAIIGLSGIRNTIQDCFFMKSKGYMLSAWCATDFKILNNKFVTAQYAIATGGTASLYASGGEIAGNEILDCSDVGIKLKFVRDTVIHHNTIDTAYITQPNNLAFTPSGIRFYHADGPTVGVTAEDNTIINSRPTSPQHTAGVIVDRDARGLSLGELIHHNRITDQYYGALINWDNVEITDNTILRCAIPIQDNGIGTIKTGNIFDEVIPPPVEYKCPIDGLVFESAAALAAHMKTHEATPPPPPPGPGYAWIPVTFMGVVIYLLVQEATQ